MFSVIRKLIMAFLLGTLTFTPWNILLAHFEVIEYANPKYLGIAPWTPWAFGVMAVVAISIFTAMDRLLHTEEDYPPALLAFEYLLIAGLYLGVLFFRSYPYLLTLGLLIVMVIRLIFFHRPWDFLFFIFGLSVGPTVELILTNFHLYLFNEPDFLGMPFWLALLWGSVAMALRRVGWLLFPPGRKIANSLGLKIG